MSPRGVPAASVAAMDRRRVGAWFYLVAAVAAMLLSLLAEPDYLQIFAAATSAAMLVLAALNFAARERR